MRIKLLALLIVLSLPEFAVASQDFGAGSSADSHGFGTASTEPAPSNPSSLPLGSPPADAIPLTIEPEPIATQPIERPISIPVPVPAPAASQPAPSRQPVYVPPSQPTYRAPITVAPRPARAYQQSPVTTSPQELSPLGLPAAPGVIKQIPHKLALSYPLLSKMPVTSGYGYRTDPVYGGRRFHGGIDYGAPTGTPVIAAASGQVIRAGQCGGYGLCVEISHAPGFSTLYGHLSRVDVTKGMTIGSRTYIGLVGSTGKSTGPHLHFSAIHNEKSVNPLSFMQSNGPIASRADGLSLRIAFKPVLRSQLNQTAIKPRGQAFTEPATLSASLSQVAITLPKWIFLWSNRFV